MEGKESNMQANETQSEIRLRAIGIIRTPYQDWAPYQPLEREAEEGRFRIEVNQKFAEGLKDLDSFKYIYVLYFLDRIGKATSMQAHPPWTRGKPVGLFSSRSPNRPNPIGLSIVRLIKVEGNAVHTSPLDVFDKTPLLDIKPYIKDLDSREDANHGWFEGLEGSVEHLMEHMRGIPHKHD